MSAYLSVMLLAVGTTPQYVPNESLVAQYSTGSYDYVDDKRRFTVQYRLHEPPIGKDEDSYPLIIWLHGFGEQGADNKEHLRWLDLVANTAPHQN